MRGATFNFNHGFSPLRFQSTHPMRGATWAEGAVSGKSFISIHAPHEGCDGIVDRFDGQDFISIHAPHEGCDSGGTAKGNGKPYFNPRTP